MRFSPRAFIEAFCVKFTNLQSKKKGRLPFCRLPQRLFIVSLLCFKQLRTNQMKHPHASSTQIFCGPYSKSEETFAERVHRISQKEFCDSHQANPALVESLLLAANLGTENLYQSTQRILTIEGILSLTIFSKKKKWLCSWGPELIDETHRLSNFSVPIIIEQKIWKIIFGS